MISGLQFTFGKYAYSIRQDYSEHDRRAIFSITAAKEATNSRSSGVCALRNSRLRQDLPVYQNAVLFFAWIFIMCGNWHQILYASRPRQSWHSNSQVFSPPIKESSRLPRIRCRGAGGICAQMWILQEIPAVYSFNTLLQSTRSKDFRDILASFCPRDIPKRRLWRLLPLAMIQELFSGNLTGN